jgi:hypothetical protein
MTNIEKEKNPDDKVDELTYDFFDNLYKLELECKYKKNPDLLDDIISEYKKLIKYYKNKKDKREEDYKHRLNMFITDPKIIQISKLKKSNKKNVSIKFADNTNERDNVKKNSIFLKTKTFLNVVEEGKENLQNSEKAFNNEMQKQDEKFKSKLKKFKKSSTMKSLKKKSSILSFTSFFNENKNDHLNNSNFENDNISSNMNKTKIEKSDGLILSELIDYDSNSEKNETNFNKILDENKSLNLLLNNTDGSILMENDNSINFVSENEEGASNLKKSFFSMNNGIINLLEKYEDIGATQKRKILSLKESLDDYLNSFNNYIQNDLIKRTTDKIQRLFKEKFDNYKKTNEDYNNDIKEFEDKKNSIDKNDPQYPSLILTIEMLKDEMQNELDKFDDQYNAKILKFKNEFQTKEVKNDPGITLLEEQLRLGVINTLQELIFPKKNETNKNDDFITNNLKINNDNENENENNIEEKEVVFDNEKLSIDNDANKYENENDNENEKN